MLLPATTYTRFDPGRGRTGPAQPAHRHGRPGWRRDAPHLLEVRRPRSRRRCSPRQTGWVRTDPVLSGQRLRIDLVLDDSAEELREVIGGWSFLHPEGGGPGRSAATIGMSVCPCRATEHLVVNDGWHLAVEPLRLAVQKIQDEPHLRSGCRNALAAEPGAEARFSEDYWRVLQAGLVNEFLQSRVSCCLSQSAKFGRKLRGGIPLVQPCPLRPIGFQTGIFPEKPAPAKVTGTNSAAI